MLYVITAEVTEGEGHVQCLSMPLICAPSATRREGEAPSLEWLLASSIKPQRGEIILNRLGVTIRLSGASQSSGNPCVYGGRNATLITSVNRTSQPDSGNARWLDSSKSAPATLMLTSPASEVLHFCLSMTWPIVLQHPLERLIGRYTSDSD